MARNLIEIINLGIRRSTTFELNVPELEVSPGVIVCVAGPNGSGKSTLIASLAGLLVPDKGQIWLGGSLLMNDLRSTKAQLGYVPDDEDWFIKELTAQEYIALLSQVYRDAGVQSNVATRARTLAKELYFSAWDQRLEHLSHGNKKKLQLVAGLMHQPGIIILDELRNGLDPLAIIAAERLIKDEAKRGACVIAATHDLWWAERVADEIVLLIDGRVAVHEPTKRIVMRYGSVEQLFMEEVGG